MYNVHPLVSSPPRHSCHLLQPGRLPLYADAFDSTTPGWMRTCTPLRPGLGKDALVVPAFSFTSWAIAEDPSHSVPIAASPIYKCLYLLASSGLLLWTDKSLNCYHAAQDRMPDKEGDYRTESLRRSCYLITRVGIHLPHAIMSTHGCRPYMASRKPTTVGDNLR